MTKPSGGNADTTAEKVTRGRGNRTLSSTAELSSDLAQGGGLATAPHRETPIDR